MVPVRVSHATREIETQVEESARKAQGKRKESVKGQLRVRGGAPSLRVSHPSRALSRAFLALSLRLPPFA